MGAKSGGLGERGEELAARYLASQGYAVVDRNWRWRQGEIDLVLEKHGELIFVEVKARRSRRYGSPEEAVTPRKQRRLIQAAYAYLQQAGGPDRPWRIDVIALDLGREGEVVRLDHYENAVGEA